MKTIFDELQQEVKNWWISLILGILYVIVLTLNLEHILFIRHQNGCLTKNCY